MKTSNSLTYLVVLISASTWVSHGATRVFTDRETFIRQCYFLPDVKQALSFDYLLHPWEMDHEVGPILATTNVTFEGRFLIATRYDSQTTGSTALFNFDASFPLKVNFEYGARAFGADFSSGSDRDFEEFLATIALSTGETFTFTGPTAPDYTFFGFITDGFFTDLTFSDGGRVDGGAGAFFHAELIRDVFMITRVPEPSSVALLVLFGGGFLLRRRWSALGSR